MLLTSAKSVSGRAWLMSLLLAVIAWTDVEGGVKTASPSMSDIVAVLDRSRQQEQQQQQQLASAAALSARERATGDKEDIELQNSVEQVGSTLFKACTVHKVQLVA